MISMDMIIYIICIFIGGFGWGALVSVFFIRDLKDSNKPFIMAGISFALAGILLVIF